MYYYHYYSYPHPSTNYLYNRQISYYPHNFNNFHQYSLTNYTPPVNDLSYRQPFDLGIIWYEYERGWKGLWSRLGNSNKFQASWTAPGEKRITADLTIDIDVVRKKVIVKRQNSSDGNNCIYKGDISPDGNRVVGTYQCDQGSGQWTAEIRRVKLGRVWIEQEDGWQGEWTRERNSPDTFTAIWRSPTESVPVTARLRMSTDGYGVTIQRFNSSDGNDCTYTGTIGTTESSAQGFRKCSKGSGSWKAQIRG
ncbi:hypothetical protein Q8G31_29970 [Priestia megaterium]|uniref:hypothetical protein n=1 Tax=Priestia megaterium TaxID=1404 RepID=UPI00272F30D1|nr:hypothetical protein [Priestia megaterium]MDP1383879.1 hypothetical protein [Priestia megaterium]MDP1428032.1 hypothetical protein [Priestia megaterium]